MNGTTTAAGATVSDLIMAKCPIPPNKPSNMNSSQSAGAGVTQKNGTTAEVTRAPMEAE